ncbi:general secretion pathway protein [Legionella geestiana]|uniref:General secretion pathway protein n=1 Tax=Legionella geestiana TaxID=45065 RepID=A0A0W0TVD6_9GAMM|nr:type II secretion system protein GspM [Legionella geestiana]KTC99655.1 general secretion pathway protein [Legionella geestiana]QBS13222.1 hypothetical protein E4T54_10980 [Legionella geestiana]STX54255.1 general secretion pathway protein [Legionella geestiana]
MIKNPFQNLSLRERLMVIGATVLTVIWLFYMLVFNPLLTKTINAREALVEKQETLAYMETVRKNNPANTTVKTLSSNQLLAEMASMLAGGEFKSFPCQIQQTASGNIQLGCDKVPFNPFVSWLWKLSERFAFTIREFSAERTDTAGVVRLSLVLSAASGTAMVR